MVKSHVVYLVIDTPVFWQTLYILRFCGNPVVLHCGAALGGNCVQCTHSPVFSSVGNARARERARNECLQSRAFRSMS